LHDLAWVLAFHIRWVSAVGSSTERNSENCIRVYYSFFNEPKVYIHFNICIVSYVERVIYARIGKGRAGLRDWLAGYRELLLAASIYTAATQLTQISKFTSIPIDPYTLILATYYSI
jgi:hypothetical protein